VVTWSCEEGGRYLETFKTYENKDADVIKEKVPMHRELFTIPSHIFAFLPFHVNSPFQRFIVYLLNGLAL
jgi:hypothetical protein